MPFQKGNQINVGKKASEETKLKMSKIRKEKGIGFQKGNIPHNKGGKGFKHSEETKEKIRQAHIGFEFSEETKQKFSEIAKNRTKEKNPMFGKHHSEETKKILSQQKLGEKSRFWNGGISIDGDGYILIYKSEHPYANKNKYVYQHRLIMEAFLNRYLAKEEVVHHINGIITDNRIENLMLFKNKKEHNDYHQQFIKENKSDSNE